MAVDSVFVLVRLAWLSRYDCCNNARTKTTTSMPVVDRRVASTALASIASTASTASTSVAVSSSSSTTATTNDATIVARDQVGQRDKFHCRCHVLMNFQFQIDAHHLRRRASACRIEKNWRLVLIIGVFVAWTFRS